MTQPMTIPARTAGQRTTRSPIQRSDERFTGRWPATDQLITDRLTAPLPEPATSSPILPDSAALAYTDVEAQQRQNSDVATERINDAETALRDDEGLERNADRHQIPAAPQASFVERLAAIIEQFTNPSTGETSVDRRLTITHQREADYEYQSSTQHQSQTGPRL